MQSNVLRFQIKSGQIKRPRLFLSTAWYSVNIYVIIPTVSFALNQQYDRNAEPAQWHRADRPTDGRAHAGVVAIAKGKSENFTVHSSHPGNPD